MTCSMVRMQMQMSRWERTEHAAMFSEVSHPIHDYDDPDKLNALWERIERAQRFPSPTVGELVEDWKIREEEA